MMENRRLWVALLFVALTGVYCAPAPEPEPEPTIEEPEPQPLSASAELNPTEGNEVDGSVSFEETDSGVQITAHVNGLTPGKHGFHIHEIGDCSAPDGTSAGGHFNPSGSEHGAPDSDVHHAGDLGNIEADEDGHGMLEVTVDFLTLSEGPNSIAGRGVIVHAQEDDFGQPTGNAGPRLACGVIEMQ